jgi:hypothetical protein
MFRFGKMKISKMFKLKNVQNFKTKIEKEIKRELIRKTRPKTREPEKEGNPPPPTHTSSGSTRLKL